MREQPQGGGAAALADEGRVAGEQVKLWLSWCWVGIPGLWGVYHVVVDALKLFR